MSFIFENVKEEKRNEAMKLLDTLMPKYNVKDDVNYTSVTGIRCLFIRPDKNRSFLTQEEFRLGIEVVANLGVMVKFRESIDSLLLSRGNEKNKIHFAATNDIGNGNISFDLNDESYIEETLNEINARRDRLTNKLTNS